MENKLDLDTIIYEKITNFKNFMEKNMLKYVKDYNMDNAIFNLGLLTSLPFFLVKSGMKSVFLNELDNNIIIETLAKDYLFEISEITTEEKLKIHLYCSFFKKYLNL